MSRQLGKLLNKLICIMIDDGSSTELPINSNAYSLAQEGMQKLRVAIYVLLKENPKGLKATDIGRALGLGDESSDQQGWIQWTVLKYMEREGTVIQPKPKGPWFLR